MARGRSAAPAEPTPERLPFPPMEAQNVKEFPEEDGWQFEPKWDGFRGVLENLDGELRLWSRNGRPLLRYFPELRELGTKLPPESALDGEIVIERDGVLQFDSLQMRLHPAESRINRLAGEIPARFVAFDVLLWEGEDVHRLPFHERRARVESLPFDISPASGDLAVARRWLERLELAGFDGVIGKRLDLPYRPGERDAVIKVKHHRTADCVVVGVRWKEPEAREEPSVVATLLLGLFDESGELRHVGSTSASAKKRQASTGGGRARRASGRGLAEHRPDRAAESLAAEGGLALVGSPAGSRCRGALRQVGRLALSTRNSPDASFRPDKDPEMCTLEQVTQPPGPDDPTVPSLLGSARS